MRVFAVSDIHVDYPENLEWILQLHDSDYLDDILILAGDVSDSLPMLRQVFESLRSKFKEVLFVPGNHELWIQNDEIDCSLKKFDLVNDLCNEQGIRTGFYRCGDISFVPLLGWYDFSFGKPDRQLRRAWRDFRACRWPAFLENDAAVLDYFLNKNISLLDTTNATVISYSHFLPRIDVMPSQIPKERRRVYPVLGSSGLGEQVKKLNPDIHVYGHSHVNQSIELDDIRYVNNAFAYPNEDRISRKQLHCVFEQAETAS